MRGRLAGFAGAGALALAAACGGSARPEPTPVPASAEPELAPPPPTSSAAFAPRVAAGTYRLLTEIQTGGQNQQPRGRQPRGQARTAQLRLELARSTAAAEGAPPERFVAVVELPGFTRVQRGRAGQGAAWWPEPGDSVVVQWTTPRGQVLQLRGQLRGSAIAGDVWFVSPASGTTFQMGTFRAQKSR